MKYLYLLLVSFLFACQSVVEVQEERDHKETVEFTVEPSQTFTIKSESHNRVEGNQGSILEIPANAFVFDNGEQPVGDIQLKLKEVFTKSDMILNKLSTISNKSLIESTGMVFIGASSEGKPLKLKNDKQIRLSIPNKEGFAKADFFEGDFNNQGIMDWSLLPSNDTIIVETSKRWGIGNGMDSVLVEVFKEIGETVILFKDSSYVVPSNIDITTRTTVVRDEFPKYLTYDLKNLGWINCDRFIQIEQPTELIVNIENPHQPAGYIVFHSLNSILELAFENGEGRSYSVPAGENVTLIVIDKKDGQYFFHKQSFILGEHKKLTVKPEKSGLANIQREIKGIDMLAQ